MKNLDKAQKISYDVYQKYSNNIKQLKWTDVYNSEQEIINDLKEVYIPNKKEEAALVYIPFYKGYEYIHSFAKQVQNGKTLTEKQIVQCKRMALNIKIAWSIRDCW